MKCRVRDIDVYYEVRGNGRPVLMLHGFWIDHHSMLGAMEPIFRSQNGWQRIYFDMPGMGQTPDAAWITGSDQMLDVVDEFVAQVIGNQPFAVAGLSYGAYIARGLLHRRFSQINGMFLFAPVVAPDQDDPHKPEHQILVTNPDVMATVSDPFKPQMEATMVVQDARIFDRLPGEFEVGLQKAKRPFLEKLRRQYAFTFDLNDLPGTFDKPALIITGRHDNGVGYWRPAQLVPYYPRATYAVLDRAGHGVNLEQEAIFNQLALDWIQRMVEMETAVSYDTGTERMLKFSVDVPASVADVWHAWTTEAGATTFFARACHIDLRVGGAYEMYFAPDAPAGERGGDGLTILAIQPERMLSFTWNAPPSLPDVREQHTAVTIRLYPLPANQTRVTLIHSGWGEGGQWDDAFAYFANAWGEVVLPRLQQCFATGPVKWE